MSRKFQDAKLGLATGITLLFWASAFVGIRAALDSYSPGHLAVFRYLIASFVLLVIALFLQIKLPQKKHIPMIMLNGLLGIAIYHSALNFGELHVSAGVASFIINAVPIFTAILAYIFLNERLKKYAWIGILISFFGVTLIVFVDGLAFNFSSGGLLVLLAAFCQSAYFVLQKPYLKIYSPLEYTTYVIWAGTILMFVFLPGLDLAIEKASIEDTLAVIYLGIFPGALGYIFFAYVLSKISASRTGSYVFIVPVLTIIIAWIWLGEIPGIISLVGGSLAIVGVYLLQKSK